MASRGILLPVGVFNRTACGVVLTRRIVVPEAGLFNRVLLDVAIVLYLYHRGFDIFSPRVIRCVVVVGHMWTEYRSQ